LASERSVTASPTLVNNTNEDTDREYLEKARSEIPEPFPKPTFTPGNSATEYKSYMIKRFEYEQWENKVFLLARKMKQAAHPQLIDQNEFEGDSRPTSPKDDISPELSRVNRASTSADFSPRSRSISLGAKTASVANKLPSNTCKELIFLYS